MDPDRRRFGPVEPGGEVDEWVDGFGEGDCGAGYGDGSDREETVDGGGDGREGFLEEGDGGLGCVGYGMGRERFESRWAPWGLSGSERSRSPERKEFSVWRSDDDDDDIKSLCELPPVYAHPLAAVAPTDVIMVAEEPSFRVGVGLRNLGNTCFLNSVLQCLVRTTPLRQGLFMIDHCSPCYDEEFCLTCCLRELVHRAFASLVDISPYSIAENLRYFSPDFMRYQQEDAHEFLQCLLNKLEKYQMFPSNPFSTAQSRNVVKQVFGGSLVSRLRCSECNHISRTPENLIDFSLEIDDVNTLEGALESFTKLEKIEDIKLTCDGCNEKVSMEKQFIIDQAPLVASFHLKRFKNDGITVQKIRKHIEYPLTLNLHPYTVGYPEQSADLTYHLYAVIVHDGFSSDSGHYYCFVQSSLSTWHEFDDSTVTRVSESHVLSREAYILFYAKRGTPWFSTYDDVQSLCYPVAPKYSPNSVLDTANQSSESDSSTENLTIRVKRHKEFNAESYQPALIGPQLPNFGAKFISNRHGEYGDLLPNNEDDKKNDVDREDSSINFDMLLNDEDKDNINEDVVTITSAMNFDFIKNEANSDRKEMVDKNGSSLDSVEKKEVSGEKICTISSVTNDENAAPSSEHEAGNFRNKCTTSPGEEPNKSPNCPAGSRSSLGVTNKNTFITEGNTTEPASSRTNFSGLPVATKIVNTMQRKRSAERPVDDARQSQIVKTLRKTNMPLTRAKKLLAAANGSPIKKNKKSPISLGKEPSPRTACRKNQNRGASPSMRSAIFR